MITCSFEFSCMKCSVVCKSGVWFLPTKLYWRSVIPDEQFVILIAISNLNAFWWIANNVLNLFSESPEGGSLASDNANVSTEVLSQNSCLNDWGSFQLAFFLKFILLQLMLLGTANVNFHTCWLFLLVALWTNLVFQFPGRFRVSSKHVKLKCADPLPQPQQNYLPS